MNKLFTVAVLNLSIFMSSYAWSHARWIVPSHTLLSSDKAEIVTFDFSVSNDIFFPDNAYGGVSLFSLAKNEKQEAGRSPREKMLKKMMASTQLKVEMPSGSIDVESPIVDLGRKSVSAFKFDGAGTYRISLIQNPIYFVSYKEESGKPGRLFGKLSDNKNKIPQGAVDIKGSKLVNNVQTFISRHDGDKKSIQPTKKGLEFEFITHPNELFEGEVFKAKVLLNGKPVKAGHEVIFIRGGTRYRNDREAIMVKADKKGVISYAWKKPGLYLVESSVFEKSNHQDYQMQMFNLYTTLEVNPE